MDIAISGVNRINMAIAQADAVQGITFEERSDLGSQVLGAYGSSEIGNMRDCGTGLHLLVARHFDCPYRFSGDRIHGDASNSG